MQSLCVFLCPRWKKFLSLSFPVIGAPQQKVIGNVSNGDTGSSKSLSEDLNLPRYTTCGMTYEKVVTHKEVSVCDPRGSRASLPNVETSSIKIEGRFPLHCLKISFSFKFHFNATWLTGND